MKPKNPFSNYFLYLAIALLTSGCMINIPELEREPDQEISAYRSYYHSEVHPYFEKNGQQDFFNGVDDTSIAYVHFQHPNERGALVILHGLNETALKYAELIYDLRDSGLSIYIMEHRGHGNSERILDGSDRERRKVFVKDFDHYVQDAKIFYDTIVSAGDHDHYFFFAHSLGGNVATQYLQRYPDDFDGAVLSSPMLEMLTTHPAVLPEGIVYPLVKFLTSAGLGKAYVVDMKEPDIIIDSTDQNKFEAELLTKSWKRWTVYNGLLEQNQQLIAGGGGATWGITNQWAKEAYEATFIARNTQNAEKIAVPILMFTSGEDYIVGQKGFDFLKERSVNSPEFEVVHFEEAYHESYIEVDEIRDQVIGKTKQFIESYY